MSETSKREYQKPVVLRVELQADEVLAVGCKTASGTSVASGGARPCRVSPCGPTGS